jgi:hypothetical protein
MRPSWQCLTILVFAAVAVPRAACAQNNPAPDIRVLMQELDTPQGTKDTFNKIVELARKDPHARDYVVQRLPEMIRGSLSDLWIDSVRLAGRLKAKEAIPALIEAMSRPPVPSKNYVTLGTLWEDGDLVGKALSQIGDPAIPAVQSLLKSEDASIRGRGILVLRNIGTPAAHEVLRAHQPGETNSENIKIIEDALHTQQK